MPAASLGAADAEWPSHGVEGQGGRHSPAGGKATPMTYRAGGRQFVVIAAGGDGEVFGTRDAIVAFSLPAPSR